MSAIAYQIDRAPQERVLGALAEVQKTSPQVHVRVQMQELCVSAIAYQIDRAPQECVLGTLAESVNWN